MSGPTITFWGAAGQVTGSCHLLEWRGHRVVLDGGLFQGKREESNRLNATLPFDPRQLDAIILSHAHIDHAGRLPLFGAHQYDKPIFVFNYPKTFKAFYMKENPDDPRTVLSNDCLEIGRAHV